MKGGSHNAGVVQDGSDRQREYRLKEGWGSFVSLTWLMDKPVIDQHGSRVNLPIFARSRYARY